MDKKKIKKFINAMQDDNCAAIIAVGGNEIYKKSAPRSFAVVGEMKDLMMLLGLQMVELFNIFGNRMGDEDAKKFFYGVVDTAFEEYKKSRQPGTADSSKKGE